MRLLAAFELKDRPIPWSPPRTIAVGGKRPGARQFHVHKRDPALMDYQDQIRSLAEEACTQDAAYAGGPVLLVMRFNRATEKRELWGKAWWHRHCQGSGGDLDNLQKATSDALQPFELKGRGKKKEEIIRAWRGCIEDDSQVCDVVSSKRWAESDSVAVRVYALEDGDVSI
jgi:Holliday junction resolvase RusA-like endonuclease